MTQFFASLLDRIHNYKDLIGVVHAPQDDSIVHLYLDNAWVGFTFSMDYAGERSNESWWSFATQFC